MPDTSQYGSGAYGDNQYGFGTYVSPTAQLIETTAVRDALRPLPPPVFTGMKLQHDIMVGDLVLNRIDENNVVWVCTDIEGWWGYPDPEIPNIPRGWGDGSYDSSGRWTSRSLSLSGVILPPDPALLPAARDTLIESFDLVRRGAWLKTVEEPTRAAFVRLDGRPSITTVNPRGRTEFTIGLRAPDPIRYEWNHDDPDGYTVVALPCKNTSTGASGSVEIENIGNIDVSMVLEVTGPITGPATIYNATTDKTITIVDALRSSETRTITFKKIDANVATLTTSVAHTLAIGDTVTVLGVDATFDGTFTVTDVPTTSTFTYDLTAGNVGQVAATGTASRSADVLEINTYSKLVAYNGTTLGARSYVDTLVDWLTVTPGVNVIQFVDAGAASSTATMTIHYRSGWIG